MSVLTETQIENLQRFVVDAKGKIAVFEELMDRQQYVVRLTYIVSDDVAAIMNDLLLQRQYRLPKETHEHLLKKP